MDLKNKTFVETKDLLENRIKTPVQAFVTDTKYPCTGFSYLVAKNRDKIIKLYNKKNEQEYYDYILILIKEAGERKRKNLAIHHKGEYINQDTIKKDFPDLTNFMTFTEVASPDIESFAIAQNNLYMLFMDIISHGYMIVTRSDETFIMLKLDSETMLIVDSHQPFHGTVNLEKATHYILKNGVYRGLSQIGYLSAGLDL